MKKSLHKTLDTIGKTIDTVEETNKNIMHVNLIDNMFIYVSIMFSLLFVIETIMCLFEK